MYKWTMQKVNVTFEEKKNGYIVKDETKYM